MVTNSGTPARPDQLRSLNPPRKLTVTEHHGMPDMLIERNRRHKIVRIQDVWNIDDEWWRESISRSYMELMLEGGKRVVVFQDLMTGLWFMQQP